MDDIKIIKLINGQDLVGRVEEGGRGTVTVIDPLVSELEYDENNTPLMVLLIWVPLHKKETRVDLQRMHVIAVSDVPKEVERHYRRNIAILKQDGTALKQIVEEMVDEKFDEKFDEIEASGSNNVVRLLH